MNKCVQNRSLFCTQANIIFIFIRTKQLIDHE
jgi:hypothetical protein